MLSGHVCSLGFDRRVVSYLRVRSECLRHELLQRKPFGMGQ